jgi:hypothetical protein
MAEAAARDHAKVVLRRVRRRARFHEFDVAVLAGASNRLFGGLQNESAANKVASQIDSWVATE